MMTSDAIGTLSSLGYTPTSLAKTVVSFIFISLPRPSPRRWWGGVDLKFGRSPCDFPPDLQTSRDAHLDVLAEQAVSARCRSWI
jgi:hypothetical protein